MCPKLADVVEAWLAAFASLYKSGGTGSLMWVEFILIQTVFIFGGPSGGKSTSHGDGRMKQIKQKYSRA